MDSHSTPKGVTATRGKRLIPKLSRCAGWLIWLTAFLVLTVSAKAQLDTGSIRGVVTDPRRKGWCRAQPSQPRETATGTKLLDYQLRGRLLLSALCASRHL